MAGLLNPVDTMLRLVGDGERWRCAGCGNLTRFDVTRTRRTTDYWHVDLAGVPLIVGVCFAAAALT